MSSNDNKSNQCNPNNERYQGHDSKYSGSGSKDDLDNHANQLNPNHAQYGGGSKGGHSGSGCGKGHSGGSAGTHEGHGHGGHK